jgi:hypothetical protein
VPGLRTGLDVEVVIFVGQGVIERLDHLEHLHGALCRRPEADLTGKYNAFFDAQFLVARLEDAMRRRHHVVRCDERSATHVSDSGDADVQRDDAIVIRRRRVWRPVVDCFLALRRRIVTLSTRIRLRPAASRGGGPQRDK